MTNGTPVGNDFNSVVAGFYYSVALKSDGSVVGWGIDSLVTSTPAGTDFAAIAGGARHALALASDMSIVSWGSNVYGQVSDTPTDTDFVAIAGGEAHSLALQLFIPEPSCFVTLSSLLGIGLIGHWWRRRRAK